MNAYALAFEGYDLLASILFFGLALVIIPAVLVVLTWVWFGTRRKG